MIENTDSILIGPGLGVDFKGNNAITFLLQNIQPHQNLIVDGDAITIFCKLKPNIPTCRVIFTPHQKEWERLVVFLLKNKRMKEIEKLWIN